MTRILQLSLVGVVLSLAPAVRAEASFGKAGSWLVAGGTYISLNSGQAEGQVKAATEYTVQLSPALAWFVAEGVALRLAPGFAWHSEPDSHNAGQNESRLVLAEFGPAWYFPVSEDRVYLVTGIQVGFESGGWTFSSGGETDMEGPRFTGEFGLALPVGTGGLAEIVGVLSHRFLSYSAGSNTAGYGITQFSFGFRYSLVL